MYAIVDGRDIPMLYDVGEDLFGIGKSYCPFPVCVGKHYCKFVIEDYHATYDVRNVNVKYVTRRHCWFSFNESCSEEDDIPRDMPSDFSGNEEEASHSYEEATSSREESIWSSEW